MAWRVWRCLESLTSLSHLHVRAMHIAHHLAAGPSNLCVRKTTHDCHPHRRDFRGYRSCEPFGRATPRFCRRVLWGANINGPSAKFADIGVEPSHNMDFRTFFDERGDSWLLLRHGRHAGLCGVLRILSDWRFRRRAFARGRGRVGARLVERAFWQIGHELLQFGYRFAAFVRSFRQSHRCRPDFFCRSTRNGAGQRAIHLARRALGTCLFSLGWSQRCFAHRCVANVCIPCGFRRCIHRHARQSRL